MATRNLTEAANRAALKYWQGLDVSGFEQPPDLISGESLLSTNAAGTALLPIIGLDSSNRTVLSQPLAESSAFGIGGLLRMARAKYDFAVDGGAISTITLATNAIIPDNAIILGGMLNSITAPVGASATIAFGTSAGSSASSLKAATAITTFTTDALVAVVPLWTAATAIKMTAAGSITMTIATTALTAGVIEVTLFYYVASA